MRIGRYVIKVYKDEELREFTRVQMALRVARCTSSGLKYFDYDPKTQHTLGKEIYDEVNTAMEIIKKVTGVWP